ncbi:tail fiber assembly protein [Pseudocitrobacter sp. 73]|uniref:tail fiber assembly protein n=1 Tax=Pseudocitrobacter sp. 73 TaxID=2605731 RepID=UPI0011EEFFFD|nr:tail fiber assembly protein [Pseudocitrobacter sp. 73]KAA1047291.1 tail fiber assembly protein [Pseudocitrobacter sp. 73]
MENEEIEIYFYSALRNAFFPDVLRNGFEDAGTWPDDALEISDDIYTEFGRMTAPYGKIMVAGENGLPEWADMKQPELSQDELIAKAEATKTRILSAATQVISTLEDAVDLGIATEAEEVALVAWKKYRVLVRRIKTENAPDIDWPEEPEDVA